MISHGIESLEVDKDITEILILAFHIQSAQILSRPTLFIVKAAWAVCRSLAWPEVKKY